jgi:hypothetical protein
MKKFEKSNAYRHSQAGSITLFLQFCNVKSGGRTKCAATA